MQRRFIAYPDLKDRYGIPLTRQHIDRLVKAQKFPSKINLTEHRVGWWSDQIEEWLSTKAAA